jgi:peptidoglycan-associated lipoprotein
MKVFCVSSVSRTTVLAFAAALLVAGCNDVSKPELSVAPQPAGVTDEPARGYAPVQPGSEEEFILQAGRRIYFASGSAELDDVARETLAIQAAWLNRNPNWLVKLQGFSDDPGTLQANIALSSKRANAVMNYLASQGVNPQRMWAKGSGKERPVRDCPEVSCKAQNRRVIVNLRTEFDDAAPQKKQGLTAL